MKSLQYLIILLFSYTCTLQAQDYPVTASTQIIPPYSLFLPDYYSGGSEKLRVILLQRDLTQPGYEISLQLTIERNGTMIMRSSPSFHSPSITLNAGVPIIISSAALADYFLADNILFSGGYSREEYERTRSLPEGSYRLTFQAYDSHRPGIQISNAIASVFFLQKSDPPLLNLPICGSRVERRDPQFLTFNWSNRNTSQANTSYIFSLYEIKPAGSIPDYTIRSTRPLYTITTDNTTMLYGPSEPALTDSMQYVWIVQAIDKEGKDLYSNQGYSQSCTFTYLGTNPFEQFEKPVLYGTVQGERQLRYHWPLNAVDAYRLQYRAVAKDNITYDWQTVEFTADSTTLINSLEPDREYEAHLQWKLSGVYSSFSDLLTLKTAALQHIACGDAGLLSPSSNKQLQATLMVGNIIRIGHYDVILTSLTNGRIITPGLGFGLEVYLNNVVVNTDFVAISGEMYAVTKGIDQFIQAAVDAQHGGDDMGKVKTGDLVADITTRLHLFTKEAIAVDTTSHTITLTDSENGTTQIIHYTTLPLLIEDANGNIYQITQQGAVNYVGKRDIALAANLANLQLSTGRIDFAAGNDNKYAFDTYHADYPSSYESLANGQYHVSAKAIIPGAQETIIASRSDTSSVVFITRKGIIYPSTCTDGTCKVTITGGPAGDAQELFAIHPDGTSIGKLLIASYPSLQKRVVLIPIGENILIPEKAISQTLAAVYGNVGISYALETDNSFKNNISWDQNKDGVLQDSKSALLSNSFTGEEKAMKRAYIQSHRITDDAVYLFMVNEVAREDAGLLGKMPRQSQFGFVFIKNGTDAEIARTVAHEIGHGDYTLEHAVSPSTNLMTTGTGLALYKFQWDIVHDPGSVWGIFEDDAGSELTKGLSLYKCLQKDAQAGCTSSFYYAPDSTVVNLPAGAVPLSVFYQDFSKGSPAMAGSLNSFEYGGKEYNAIYFVSTGKFKGYSYDKYDTSTYIYSRSKQAGDDVNIIEAGKEIYTCTVKVNNVPYANDGCLCQDNKYTQQYNRLMLQVIGSDQPEVQAEIAAICKTIISLPGDVLATSDELFNCYYDNPELYYIDWNESPDVLSFEQLKQMHQQLKELDSSIQLLKRCEFTSGSDIVKFINAHFVIAGTKTSYLTHAQFSDLTPEVRACLITKLLKDDYGQRWTVSSGGFGGQNIMLEIIRNCAGTAALHEVIKRLQQERVLYTLLSDTYDYLYFSKGNFTQLCNAITVAWLNEEKPGNDMGLIQQLATEKRWLVFDNGYLTASNQEDFKDREQKISLETREGVGAYLKVILSGLDAGGLFSDYAEGNPFTGKFNPLDYLIVIPRRDVSAYGTTLEQGLPYIFPAISVYGLFKQDTKAAAETFGALVLNTGLCAIGMEGLMGAGAVKTGVEMLNVSLASFVTYANVAPEMYQDHPELVKYTNYLAMAYMVGSLTVGSVKAIRNARVNVPAEMMAGRYVGDINEIEKRSVILAEEELLQLKKYLRKLGDDKVYIVVRKNGNGYTVINNGEETILEYYSLVKYLDELKIPANKEIVLLSSKNLSTAKELCKIYENSIIVNDGWVNVYENGVIESEYEFVRVFPDDTESVMVRVGKDERPGSLMVSLGDVRNAKDLAKDIYYRIRGELKLGDNDKLWFSVREIRQIITRAKAVGIDIGEVEDMIFNACSRGKYSLDEVIKQLDGWNVVRKRGYPYLFNNEKEFREFGDLLKGLAKEWGLPNEEIYAQGSALTIGEIDQMGAEIEIRDLDVMIRVGTKEFEKLVERFEELVESEKIQKLIGQNGKIGGLNMLKSKEQSGLSFTKEFYDKYELFYGKKLTDKMNTGKVQISIILKDGSLDLKPNLKF
ncbi:fibronectin type III domain-containing protein [Chitinophaga sp. LS1]|uniref:fibronectin type III domain-containing protein n=1 Tax=Chitinophaga sp. LS1 TaxID=3051176 RepID=UPI002AAA9283|nr:fibronectin type III domain-containing protein [Chitinophaga sp. LS1]WPV65836.1 fibronectin type III domain-containing protein [Chitinophaga sp. LS1]